MGRCRRILSSSGKRSFATRNLECLYAPQALSIVEGGGVSREAVYAQFSEAGGWYGQPSDYEEHCSPWPGSLSMKLDLSGGGESRSDIYISLHITRSFQHD